MKKLILLLSVACFSVCAQAQNTIDIYLSGTSYDCMTGKLTVTFHITNSDGSLETNFHTIYSIDLGASGSFNKSTGSSDDDITFTGDYSRPFSVKISAYGISNNGAPYTEFIFDPLIPDGPGKPSITGPAMPVCDAMPATLTAIGGGMDYAWSNGNIGSAITVTTSGIYTVRESNYCGTSPDSDPFTVSYSTVPPKPSISSSAGTWLCNGEYATLTSTTSGGTINWNTAQTGTSISTNSAGTYYASETNACGTSPNSDPIQHFTNTSPVKPAINMPALPLCNGLSGTLSVDDISGNSYTWSNGPGGVTNTVTDAGSYKVLVQNGCGSVWSDPVTITTASTPAAPTITAGGSLVICDGNATVLFSNATETNTWFKNGAFTGGTGNTYFTSAAGNYTVKQYNACGISPESNTITLTSNNTPPAPSLNETGSINLCDGAGKLLSTTTVTSGGVIHWNTGATGNSITVYAAGSYYAWETNASCGNGPNTPVVTITTLNKPTAPALSPSSDQHLCNGASVTITASGSNIVWNNGVTGNTLTTTNAGTYHAYDNNGCGNSNNSSAVVVTTGTCATPTPGSSYQVCPGTQKTLDAGAGYDTYSWNNGSTTQTISVGPGTYSVTVTKSGCSATSSVVTVSYYTVLTPVINPSAPTTFCAGNSITLTANTSAAYSWNTGQNTQSIVVNAAGTYNVTVTDNHGCTSTATGITTNVNPLATATIAGTTTICQSNTAPQIIFNASNGTAPYTFTYKLNGGADQTISTTSGNSVTLTAPTGTPGNYTYSLVSIRESSPTTCLNTVTGTATVTVNPLPAATISGTTTICQNSTQPQILFSGSGGTAPYKFTYQINGITKTITTTTGNTIAIDAPTTTPGTFQYELQSVQESSSTNCINTVSGSATITVNELPTASITGTTTTCQNSLSPTVTFTATGGTTPYTFTYRINNGALQTIQTNPGIDGGRSITVAAPTNEPGIYNYALVSVQESSSTNCINTVDGIATITVNEQATASITGAISVCQYTTSPLITFTANKGIAPYSFAYTINGGATQNITTISGNSISIPAPTTQAGVFTYSLISIRERSSTGCLNSANGSITDTIHQLATATIYGTDTICQYSNSPAILFKASGGIAPYTFSFKLNNETIQTAKTIADTSVTLDVPTTIPGDYQYSLLSVKESSALACINTASGDATVTINPLARAAISGTTAVCQYLNKPVVTFSAKGGTPPYIFTYSINNGANKTVVTNVTDTFANLDAPTDIPGIFNFQLISIQESSNTHCINSASGIATITIYPQPGNATIATPNTHLCNGASEQITVYNYTPGFTYSWYFNNDSLTTTAKDTIQNNKAGVFKTMAISDHGCTAAGSSNAVTITTGTIATPIITGYLHVCPGGKTTAFISPKDYTQPYETFAWLQPPQQPIIGKDSNLLNYAGNYLVKLTREGCFDSTFVVITNDDTAFPKGNVVVDSSTIQYGNTVRITANTNNTAKYNWDFGNGHTATTVSNTQTENYFIHSDSIPIHVWAISPRNCITPFTSYISVLPQATIAIPDLSVKGNLKDFNVYPNPFHDRLQLSISLTSPGPILIQLYTADAVLIRSWSLQGTKGENLLTLDQIETLPTNTLYYITAIYNNQKHYSKVYKY